MHKIIIETVKKGSLEEIKNLLDKCDDLHFHSGLALGAAAYYGNLEMVSFLMEQYENTDISKALFFGAQKGYFKIIKFLMRYCKEENADYVNRALYICASNGYLEIVSLLLKSEYVNKDDKKYSWMQSEYGHIKIIYNMNTINGALIAGARNGHLEIVILLIKNGAKSYDDALRISACNGYVDIVRYLVSNGANIIVSHFITDCIDSINTLLPFFKNKLTNSLNKITLERLLKSDLSKYQNLVNAYREKGIDVYDMVEKEQ